MSEIGAATPRVTAIVPIWNEERTLEGVVEALLASGLLSEIVCVNDGSTDGTSDVLDRLGARIVRIDLPENRGKGAALAAGINAATGEVVAFFDADLVNLAAEHLAALLAPLLLGDPSVRGTLGLLANDNPYAALVSAATGTRFSGVRAYHRTDLLPHLGRMSASRFGVEVYLNEQLPLAISRVVPLTGLGSLGKHDKQPPVVAARGYANAAKEIARELLRLRLDALGDL